MKQWQQSHLIITATTVPVALLLCWLIYKKTSSKDKSSEKRTVGLDAKSASGVAPEEVSTPPVDECAGKLSVSLLSALSESESENEDLSPLDGSKSTSCIAAVEDATPKNDVEINNVNSEHYAKNAPNQLAQNDGKNATCSQNQSGGEEKQELPSNSEAQQCLPDKHIEPSNFPKHSCTQSHQSDVEDVVVPSGDSGEVDCKKHTMDGASSVKVDIFPKNANKLEDAEAEDHRVHDENELASLESPVTSEDNSQDADDAHGLEEDDSAFEKDIDINANNNNNNKPAVAAVVENVDVNGSEDSGCECKTETVAAEKEPCTNGWHSNSNCESGEEVSDDCSTNSKKSSHRLQLQTETNNGNDSIEVFVEFPSERVGLLIGKQGRNIKQLKQDSGADIFVHEAPMRDDIQVLQICGTQSEIESCVSRIKRRFTDISLNQFDTKDMMIPSPNSAMSPMNTPPPMMYPVSNISQLRLPDGITVEVIVSAIADVDCVFVQQFTHPTFHALANLERAMSICYSEPSTPDIPHPVQVGLICAVQQQGLWYRAQIVQVFEDTEEVTIRFMDYGGYATVADKALKQIRADFVTLPFQATECYIDNIAPPKDNKFCEDSVKKLQEMLQDGRFQARVTGYRSDGHPRIHLFKCLPNKVLLINQEMATKGLATWVEPAPYSRA